VEKPKIVWSRRASIQFERAQNFIAAYDELAADDFLDEALALIDGLLDNAYIGRKVPEYDLESVRERICKAFCIIYRVGDDKNIEILAVFFDGQLLPDRL
jgi:plasmid stabilization system protein ParE